MRNLAKYLLTRSSIGRLSRPILRNTYEKRFWPHSLNQFSGVFGTYDEAVRHASAHAAVGWNHRQVAEDLVGQELPRRDPNLTQGLPTLLWQTSTFAVLLWLNKLVKPGWTIVDVGGAGGVTYWHYRDYFSLPQDVSWTVVDMPELVARGRALAERHGAGNLKFLERIADVDRCDVVVSSGCIQYMSPAAFDEFRQLAGRAKNVIVNKMPLVEGAEYWTLQSLQTSVVPYWIANQGAFLEGFRAAGLEVCDSWNVNELSVEIPFEPRYYVNMLRGVVLRKT